MIEYKKKGNTYRIPGNLTDFQLGLYVHLINWKWEHITKEPGYSKYRGRKILYDAILPESERSNLPLIHPSVVGALREHVKKYRFRLHRYFHHMASSQVANINLFLPLLIHPKANDVLAKLIPDFSRLATDHLDRGYRIEYWDEGFGTLGDKSPISGTDSDLAIAYYNKSGELCLWLIEHKLAEKEFTPCGGYRSKGKTADHDCTLSFSEILGNNDACYHHSARKRNYWKITEANVGLFPHHGKFGSCPFRGGMNQLWRNQLLAQAVAQDPRQTYKHGHFSVVRHPENRALDKTLGDYQALVGDGANVPFSSLTSADVIAAAESLNDPELTKWAAWYRDLYMM